MAIGTGTAIALGLGAAAGLGRGIANKKASDRDKKIRAATVEYSPWTGMSDPGETRRPGIFDTITQGALSGAIAGQALQGLGGAKKLPIESPDDILPSEFEPENFTETPIYNPYTVGQSAWQGVPYRYTGK